MHLFQQFSLKARGHISALLTIILWSVTFISTKILLDSYTPFEILLTRFLMGFLALCFIGDKLPKTTPKQELQFAMAGLTGIGLYYLFENVALTYTYASNVGIIVAAAPFFVALLAHFFLKDEPIGIPFFIGFVAAMSGIVIISMNGSALHLNPLGDLLAILAALDWSVYSIIMRRITLYGYDSIAVTRRTFFYGILFMLPMAFFTDFRWGFERLTDPVNLINLLFLGFGASALCFITWNFSVKALGAVQATNYIYAGPVLTVISAAIILGEKITSTTLAGIILILAGLSVSQGLLQKLFSRTAAKTE